MLVRKELAVSEFSICAKKLKDLGDLVIFFFFGETGSPRISGCPGI